MSAEDQLRRIKGHIERFAEYQQAYKDCGARDTEPDGVFQGLLVAAAKGREVQIPRDPGGWELFDGGRSKLAALHLGNAAEDCVREIRRVPLGDAQPVLEYLKDFCWRIHW